MDKTSHSHKKEQHASFLTSLIFFIAAGCFVASLFLPVFLLETKDTYGYWVLFLGWLGAIFFQFAWYATPLMLWAINESETSPRFALFLAILAIVVASQAFSFTEIPLRELKLEQKILGYGLGFYLWYASFYVAALGVLQKLVLWRRLDKVINNKQDELNHQARVSRDFSPPIPPKTGVTKKIIVSQCQQQNKRFAGTPPPIDKPSLRLP